MSCIYFKKEKRTENRPLFTLGDLYPKQFKRLTDKEYEDLKPNWVYKAFSEAYDINVSKNYVIEAIVRKIERKSGKKINDVYYQCSYD